MAKSQETFNKKEKEKKRAKKRKDKLAKREERKSQPKDTFADMIAYVDENGQLTDTPPDPSKRIKVVAASIELDHKREKEVDTGVPTGIVEFFNDAKGFGFIKDSKSSEKYFVHVNGCIDDIKEGNVVTYELEKGLKGMQAVRVKKA